MITAAEARRKATAVAERFTGWTVWVTDRGNPVATRSGSQRPPEPYDGNWAQTVMADGWKELETELAAQAKYDEQRLTIRATHGLQYQADDTCRPRLTLEIANRIERWVESADDVRRGDTLSNPASAD